MEAGLRRSSDRFDQDTCLTVALGKIWEAATIGGEMNLTEAVFRISMIAKGVNVAKLASGDFTLAYNESSDEWKATVVGSGEGELWQGCAPEMVPAIERMLKQVWPCYLEER
jgi:hypothetical protein